MRAVVLVGGFGTRLRPLTLHTPKQMLPVCNRPMLEWVLAQLARHGICDAVLSLGYRPDAFQEAFPDGLCAGVRLHYAVEPEPLDTAGAVRFAACHAGIDERFVVLNGDVLTDLDLGALLAFHDRQGAEGTIALHRVKDPSAFGVVPTDDDGRVVAFVEKPPLGEAPTDLINAGTYVLEPSVIDRIPDGRRVSVERETFPAMVADRSLYALADGEVYWLDLGTPAAYLQAQLDLIDGVRALEASGVDPAAVVTPGAVVQRSVVAGGASVGPGSVVERSAVGARASIGPGAIVRGSVLLPGAKVEAGACVEGSIVGARAVVGAGARLVGGTVVGHDVVVLPGQQLAGVRVPEGT